MSKLIIIGDSWGCGEWYHPGDNQIAVSHPGLNQYLADDYDLVNLSRPYASLWQTYYSLFNYLEQIKHIGIPEDLKIVLLQTDAYRPQLASKFQVDLSQHIKECSDLVNLYTRLLEIFYIKCHDLADKFRLKLLMCGGLSDLDLDVMSLYNNLVPVCPSWIKLMVPEHQPSTIPLRADPNLFVACKEQNRLDLCEEIFNHSDRRFLDLQHILESKYFGPGMGDFHPSRQGHQLFSDFLKDYLKNLL